MNNPDVTWQDIAQKAASGELNYAMTNPAASNSGFSALVGVASAYAGTGNALTDLRHRRCRAEAVLLGAGAHGGQLGVPRRRVRPQPGFAGRADQLRVDPALAQREPAGSTSRSTLIYPKDGIITADYPLMLLNAGEARAVPDRLRDRAAFPGHPAVAHDAARTAGR